MARSHCGPCLCRLDDGRGMNPPPDDHPSDSVLSEFGRRHLDAFLATTVTHHLAACPNCRGRLSGLSGSKRPIGPRILNQ